MSYVIAAIIAVVLFFYNPSWFQVMYQKFAGELPGPLFSIMGFEIAATAIIVSAREGERLKALTIERPDLWKQLIRLFTTTAFAAGTFALFLIFFDYSAVNSFPSIYKRIVYSLSAFLFLHATLQVGTSIYALEMVATAPSKTSKDNEDKAHGQRFSPPERSEYTKPRGSDVEVD